MDFSDSFLKQTAIDYDLDFEEVKKVYKENTKILAFYQDLEDIVKERRRK